MDQEREHGDEAYLLPREVAEELGGVTSKTIGRWAKQGKLPFLRTLGGHRRYPATAIRELAATLSHEPETDDTVDPDLTADGGLTDGFPPGAGEAPLFPPTSDR
jgi:excisionase family DNA binding protein